jgi:hypothetical protein
MTSQEMVEGRAYVRDPYVSLGGQAPSVPQSLRGNKSRSPAWTVRTRAARQPGSRIAVRCAVGSRFGHVFRSLRRNLGAPLLRRGFRH